MSNLTLSQCDRPPPLLKNPGYVPVTLLCIPLQSVTTLLCYWCNISSGTHHRKIAQNYRLTRITQVTPTIEGFHAKGAYIAFGPIFIFSRIELIFGRLTCFDMKSIVANCFCWFVLRFREITYAKKLSSPKDTLGKLSILHRLFLENEAQINKNHYATMLFMSKQVSLQKLPRSCKK